MLHKDTYLTRHLPQFLPGLESTHTQIPMTSMTSPPTISSFLQYGLPSVYLPSLTVLHSRQSSYITGLLSAFQHVHCLLICFHCLECSFSSLLLVISISLHGHPLQNTNITSIPISSHLLYSTTLFYSLYVILTLQG